MQSAKGFTRIRLFFGIAFAGLVLAAVYSQLAPLEKIKQQKDFARSEYGEKVLAGIDVFYAEKKRLPWTDDLASEKRLTPLTFIALTDPAVGICNDKQCTAPGELAQLENSLFPPPTGTFFVGRGQASRDPTYVCFVPESEDARKKTGELWEIDAKNIFRCSGRVDWKENNCFVCVQ